MVKDTFTQNFEKAVNFYDHTYHMHKATYKGLASFYKDYSDVQRDYADATINLSKTIWSHIPELRTENPTILSTVKEIMNSMHSSSQLHYNYGERLKEVSSFYQSEYSSSKKKKENHMKIIKDRTLSDYENFKEKNKSKQALNEKEKAICKKLYQDLDKLADEENDRIQKIKEQTIIYMSLYKKICDKELERTNQYNLELIKQNFQVNNSKLNTIAELIRDCHNNYEGEKIERKSYDISRTMIFNRESIRHSVMIRERINRLTVTMSSLKKAIEQFESIPGELEIMNNPTYYYGLLDEGYFCAEERRKLSQQFSSPVIRAIAFDLLDGYTQANVNDYETKSLLLLIKGKLKLGGTGKGPKSYKELKEYWKFIEENADREYQWHVGLIQELWKIYDNDSLHPSLQTIKTYLRNKNSLSESLKLDLTLNAPPFQISVSLLDVLLDAVCSNKQGESVLVDGFVDFLVVMARFGEEVLKMNREFTVLILLKKVERLIGNRETSEQLEDILNEKFFTEPPVKKKYMEDEVMENKKEIWIYELINCCTKRISDFYNQKPSLLNYIKIFLLIEKLGLITKMRFNARERVYLTLRYAGFNFLKSSQTTLKIFESEGCSGSDRLKNIVDITEGLDYEGIMTHFIRPAATELSQLLGVGQTKVEGKMFDEFTEPFYKIMDANMHMMAESESVDEEGYALRLGIILARLDLLSPLPVTEYDSFFTVLKVYLESTEKKYDSLLQHSRETELWIMEDNELATPNCIDFCSLLYKPFEFLLISLKKLEEAQQTDYTKKYAEFIKLRLNTVLRNQIIKYVSFLHESLDNYRSKAPILDMKPKRVEKMHKIGNEETEKDRYNFKELSRRLFNLLFLKEQLEEMICDFIDPQVYRKLENSIFNLDKLKKNATQDSEYREILTNIREIVEAVLAAEAKIVKKVAQIAVFHFFRKIFDNLYFQDEKNAFEEFFSSNSDYKLSDYTFVSFQENLEEWFKVISKNIPDEFLTPFSEQFAKAFYQAIKFQVLNSNKFKIPISSAKTIPYLNSDVNFISTMMKQKFFDEDVIRKEITIPFEKLIDDLQRETTKLFEQFESATLKNDKQQCKYILIILNLRAKDEKAVEFIKKYKTVVK